MAKVGVGRSDGFWERGLHAWDMAAALVIVEEGGGRVSDYAGGVPTLDGGELVASNGPLHGLMLEVLAMGGASSAASSRGVPSEKGDPPPKSAMRNYILGLIYRGPNRIADEKAADELQRAHLANNARLYNEGKLILAGPFRGDGDLRGLFLFDL